MLVKDIRAGINSSNPTAFTNIKGNVFFAANDGVNGIEIWKSNGSAGGSFMVKDIRVGALGSSPTSLHNLNSTLFFSADDGVNGRELWKSTAFGPGTFLVANINPGGGSSNPAFLASTATTLYFAASDGTSGSELWTLSNPIASAFQGLTAALTSGNLVANIQPRAVLDGFSESARMEENTMRERIDFFGFRMAGLPVIDTPNDRSKRSPYQSLRIATDSSIDSFSRRVPVASRNLAEPQASDRGTGNRILRVHTIGEFVFYELEPQRRTIEWPAG